MASISIELIQYFRPNLYKKDDSLHFRHFSVITDNKDRRETKMAGKVCLLARQHYSITKLNKMKNNNGSTLIVGILDLNCKADHGRLCVKKIVT